MENQNKCKHCNGLSKPIINTRTKFSKKGDFYPGIDLYIDNNKLNILAVSDTRKPNYIEEEVEINYCPICGRKLNNEDSTYFKVECLDDLWFSSRQKLELMYKDWMKENKIADSINNFIVFLNLNDLIDTKKTIEFLRMVGDRNEKENERNKI